MTTSELAWLNESEDGRAWLSQLPDLVDACARRWSLQVGRPFPDAFLSLVMPVRLHDGSEAVLKIAYPHHEAELEGATLIEWNGNGAVRLIAQDGPRWALLMERCVPGTALSEVGQEEGLEVLGGLLPRLWVPAGKPFRSLEQEAAHWAEGMPAKWEAMMRPFERSLLDEALAALTELPATQGEQVLLHQDLHGANVLRAQREPWLVIDPKPLVGEREFGLAPIVRSFEFGDSRDHVIGRLDRLSEALGLDRERARRWTIGQAIAWCFDSRFIERHVQTARWLSDA